jgi:murein DD-endopeptidase MepM/ murein hydrolase activator NlpD
MKMHSSILLTCFILAAQQGVNAQIAEGFQFPTTIYESAITFDFGASNHDYGDKLHTGQDILARSHHMAVNAAAPGKVMFARRWKTCPNWGYVLVIEHTLSDGSKVSSIYGHLDPSTVLVKEGQVLTGYEPIGKTGSFACWSEHLHFGIYNGAFGAPVGQYPSWLSGYLSPGAFPGNYLNPLEFILSHLDQSPKCPSSFTDDFNRPDGPVGNGWTNTIGDVNGDLLIHNGVVTTPGPAGRAGIYRPVDLSLPVTVSARLTDLNGFGGLLDRYDQDVLFGSNGTLSNGYGISLHRGDQNYSDSSVNLTLNGTALASAPSSFQFGSAITVTVTLAPDGSITGSVTGDGNTFDFSFGPRAGVLSGSNLAIDTAFPDNRSTTVFTNPTIDNVSIAYSCGVFPE